MTRLSSDSIAPPTTDRSHDVLRSVRRPLHGFFHPRNVAVIGATETKGSVGRTVLWNLISSPFGGTVYPVNPKRPSVCGIKAYPSIKDVPDRIELAVIVTPASSVPAVIAECVEVGVPYAIIISAGFSEMGESGHKLGAEILAHARRSGMRIIGPNCLGVMSPLSGLNATFAAGMARPGRVAFVSQSGALLTAILDWSVRELVGFSAVVSVGSMLDVSWGDLIDYLGDDPHTQAILIYMESIGDARSFVSAAREVALTKPIIAIKAGRTAAAAKAAASHTGTLTGRDDVLDAAFARAGVLRVDSIDRLFSMAEVLSRQPRPHGPRLAIVTNAGGPGVLATDALITNGGELAPLSDASMKTLDSFLPAAWSRNNPIDILGDAEPKRYAQALETVAKDPNADGMLVILTPQDMTDPTQTAEQLKGLAKIEGKPVLASWMGGPLIRAGEDILNQAGIATFAYPDEAAFAFADMWRYAKNLQELYETPRADAHAATIDHLRASAILAAVRKSGRTLLDEVESKQLLAAYGIPTVPTSVARSVDDAVKHADQIGYPVVVKIYSHTITHKTDVGGVRLNLQDAAAVRAAYDAIASRVDSSDMLGVTVQPMIKLDGYELILGASPDPQFGPVLLFGHGGQLVEVLKDRALGLPPLTATLAKRMMTQTRIFTALQGVRGRPPTDIDGIADVLVRFSQLILDQPRIAECDINPLLVSHERMVALDARVVLVDPAIPDEAIARSAIRPYPSQWTSDEELKDGTRVHIRPIRPEDEPAMVRFHERLSARTVWLRYFHPMQLSQRTAHERLIRVCFTDYDREMPLVAMVDGEIVAVARLSKTPLKNDAEFALLVSDEYQNQGLGTKLLARLVDIGRQERLSDIHADILAENAGMQRVAERVGFKLTRDSDGVIARLKL